MQKLIQTSYCEAVTKCTPLMPTGTPARKKKKEKHRKIKKQKLQRRLKVRRKIKNREKKFSRLKILTKSLMLKMSKIRGCIYLSKDPQRRLIISPSNQWKTKWRRLAHSRQKGNARLRHRVWLATATEKKSSVRVRLVDAPVSQNQN